MIEYLIILGLGGASNLRMAQIVLRILRIYWSFSKNNCNIAHTHVGRNVAMLDSSLQIF